MRIAFFSPMPPARSGIADYSAALLPELRRHAKVDVFSSAASSFDPSQYDVVLYQAGNNPYHSFVYEEAMRTEGVIVLHEANLHHLIADLTIKRGDWDGYLHEVECDGGPEALAYARRVRALKVGPDYEGVPMLRRLLERSRAVIAHSRFVADQARIAGFGGPVGVIPHGAWLEQPDGLAFREELGVDAVTPLIGIFGFLKPYKRIPESLRAFRRLLRVRPDARLLLAGEAHPDLPLDSLIRSLELTGSVRQIGYCDAQQFTGYISACDVVLNMRYPTVGETSGTLLRALGLGRAVLVSDVGAFAEYPDDICLKVPVDATEEDCIFEYLNLLISRPDLREAMGRRALEWVARECSWENVAQQYAAFLQAVTSGNACAPTPPAPRVEDPAAATTPPVEAEYVQGWAQDRAARGYTETHGARLLRTLEITPPGEPDKRVLEMGAYLHITPALKSKLNYGEVRGCYYGPAGQVVERRAVSETGEEFVCTVDLFDAERDPFPYTDAYFDTVLCCELIEHLPSDPMHMMFEVNRVLKPGGHLVLTTPNAVSLRALDAILVGYHPGFFPAYILPKRPGEEAEPRHAREYAPREIAQLLGDSGFEVVLLDTGEFRDQPRPEQMWVRRMLEHNELPVDLRGDDIFAVGRKTGRPRERYPSWLYS
jgi:glycosyltransferase involved in cell wall biosynthesis/SAM-dependent methyltransferase